jgi:hypothetical protein
MAKSKRPNDSSSSELTATQLPVESALTSSLVYHAVRETPGTSRVTGTYRAARDCRFAKSIALEC